MEWETVSSTLRIDSPHFRVRQDDIRLPSGRYVDGYYVWESPSIATVVPRTESGEFVLVRQWRHAVGRTMLQFPAGAIDDGESPEQAAHRELFEETGYTAPSMTHLGETVAFPTKATGWHHLFLADHAQFQSPPPEDPMEQSATVVVTQDELQRMLLHTEIQVAGSVTAGLLALQHIG